MPGGICLEKNTENTIKNMGQYYTPEKLAMILARCAVTSKSQTILDPSCGYGSLLKSAAKVLESFGSKHPGKQLFGIDIDSKAIRHLKRDSDLSIPIENLTCDDFLLLRKRNLKRSPFDLILCNPPYTRHHELDEKLLKAAKDVAEEARIDLSKASAYWTYFVIHSMNFLKIGGRMSMLLPLAILEALYSKRLQRAIEYRFERIEIHILRPGYFKGIQEHVVLLDALGYRGLGTVHTIFNSLDGHKSSKASEPFKAEGWNLKNALLPGRILDALKKIQTDPRVHTIGKYFEIRIGVVTGANRFFLLSSSEICNLDLPESWFLPIIARTPLLKGLGFTPSDYRRALHDDEKIYMINTSGRSSIPPKLKKYLSSKESDRIRESYHCRNRDPWHSIKHLDRPHAFFHYMSSSLPHIVLNNSLATCTNTIHRLTKLPNISANRMKTLSLSSITSLSALSSEIEGRSLGGGLLKLEPSAVRRVLLAVPVERVSSSVWREVDKLLRSDETKSAIEKADQEVLEEHFGIKKKVLREFRTGHEKLRDYRLNKRNSKRKKR